MEMALVIISIALILCTWFENILKIFMCPFCGIQMQWILFSVKRRLNTKLWGFELIWLIFKRLEELWIWYFSWETSLLKQQLKNTTLTSVATFCLHSDHLAIIIAVGVFKTQKMSGHRCKDIANKIFLLTPFDWT